MGTRDTAIGLAAAVALAGACGETGSDDAPSPPPDTVVAAVTAPPQSVTAASGSYGAFAYADSSGTRLLALSAPAHPDSVAEAVCQSRTRLPVRFVGHQPRAPADNGRQRAHNFDNEEGDVFQVTDGSVRPDETCFLATAALLALGPPRTADSRPQTATDSSCAAGDRARLSQAKARQAVSCARIRAVDALTHVVAVEFERRGDSALASLVLFGPDGMTFLDFPAVHEPEGDTWRVGDGGTFDPSAFDILFIIHGPSGKAIAVTWGAEEGESLTLAATAAAGDTFVPLVQDYRYWLQ
jgi:hypothetical protein